MVTGMPKCPIASHAAFTAAFSSASALDKKNTDFLVLLCLPALFLTFGKVNGAKIDRFLGGREGGGGFLTLGKVNGAKIDRFFGGGEGGS